MQNVVKLVLIITICFGCQSSTVKSKTSDSLAITVKKKTLGKVLFVVSNQKTYGNTNLKTSNHFGEIVYAYDVLINAGYQVDFVSPNGGKVLFGYLNKSKQNPKEIFKR